MGQVDPEDCSSVGCPGAESLKQQVEAMLLAQGFNIDEVRRGCACNFDKHTIRRMNREAVASRQQKARSGLERHEDRLLAHFASGHEVDPTRIQPRLVEVQSNSEEELLFRYAVLHWSIPVSAGYGRRIRFLVVDDHNEKLIGLFGLGDPVYAIGPRDRWIGWDENMHRHRLRHVMDAFALGAVPPYNDLLCGKLTALLTTCNEVRAAIYTKYTGRQGLISADPFSGQLAMLTTTSALGRSSIYNRLKFQSTRAFISVGFTAGSGDFHFANGIYKDMRAFADHHCSPKSKHQSWGKGWRNRRELVRSVLASLGLSSELVYHGVQRELFVAPLATNTREFLRGSEDELVMVNRPASEISSWFRDRWLLKRAAIADQYRSFQRESLRIWGGEA